MYLRNIGGPAHDIRIETIGTQSCGLAFDEIPVLLATDPPRQLVFRFLGRATSIWDVLAFIEIQNLEPLTAEELRIRQNKGPEQADTSRRIVLRLDYRDANDNDLTTDEYYLHFLAADNGASINNRLVVRRTPKSR